MAGLKKLRVVRNPNYQKHGLKSYVSLMNKYGFDSTKEGPYCHINKVTQRGLARSDHKAGGRARKEHLLVKKATSSGDETQTGQVTAEDQQNDIEYLVEVEIGTPAQKLLLDFDTGSSDLWVFSTSLSKSLQSGHNVFDPSKSSTWKALSGESWNISYGDGSSASGTCGTDLLNIGGVKVESQTVELANQLSDQFAQSTGDGLLGLAFSSINTVTPDQAETPVANMISQGDIPSDAQLFTSAFYSERDSGEESFYTFGFIDQDLVSQSGSDIIYTDIDNSQGFWMFDSASYSLNGQTSTISGNKAIADTGTTLMLVSDEVVDALYKEIPGATYDSTQQGYIFPTSVTADSLPDFTIAVGDTQFMIQKEALAFALADDSHWYGGVQSRGTNPFDILGDVFLRNIYAIWDQGNTRFGAVPKLQATQNLTPPSGSEQATSEKKTSQNLLSRM